MWRPIYPSEYAYTVQAYSNKRSKFLLIIYFHRNLAHTTTGVVHHIIYINNRIITIARLDKVKNISKEEAESLLKRMIAFYGNLQVLANGYLV